LLLALNLVKVEAHFWIKKMSYIKEEILRRMEIAAGMFGWSPAHVEGFKTGVDEALGKTEDIYGIIWKEFDQDDIDSFFFGKRETKLSHDDLVTLGRYEAWLTVRSWLRPDPDPTLDAAIREAHSWWDSEVCGCAKEDADIEVDKQFDVGQMLAIQSRDEWIKWLVEQHEIHLAEGSAGYSDLVLEKHHTPKFVVDNGNDQGLAILDGWHRFAADIATDTRHAVAVIIRPKPSLDDDGIKFTI